MNTLLSNLRFILTEILRDHCRTLSNLCDVLNNNGKQNPNDKDDKKVTRLILYNKVNDEVSRMRERFKFETLVDLLDKCHNGLIKNLESQVTSLTSDEIIFISLMLANFSTQTICFLLDIRHSSFYNRRKKIFNKLKDANAKDLLIMLGAPGKLL